MVSTSSTPESKSERGIDRDQLVAALANEEFFLVYQPEFDLQTNAFTGVEALIRWRSPHGIVAPDEFLPELETSGDIVAVGRWALATACRQAAEWHDMGYRFSVSVNVSARELEGNDYVSSVNDALLATRLAPSQLVLEFAQRVMVEQESGLSQLADLRSKGVRVAVDDFAPDQSTLEDFATAPVDIIKLSRSFIATLDDREAAEQVHALVRTAKESGIQVVAAGVEDAEQRRLLQLENVGVGQGFHFAAPREAGEISQFLLDYSIFSGKPI
jgi:EAL domain-containing protein (putative c-di-GMP-specific phosphodiesterase class I)